MRLRKGLRHLLMGVSHGPSPKCGKSVARHAQPKGDINLTRQKWCPGAESNHRHGDFQADRDWHESPESDVFAGSCVPGRPSRSVTVRPIGWE